MEKVHSEQLELILTIRRRRRRLRGTTAGAAFSGTGGADSSENSAAHFTSQHLLSLCFGAYIVVNAVVCPPFSTTIIPDYYHRQPLSINLFKEKFLTKSTSPTLYSLLEMHSSYFSNKGSFKSRPVRIRYRNDQFLLGPYEYNAAFCTDPVVRPLLAEDHNYAWLQGPSSSSYTSEPFTSYDSVTTQGWGREIQAQKGNFFPFTDRKFYGPDLTSLAEKNIHQPLSSSEVAAYQNSAKGFYAGYLTQTERHRCCSVSFSSPTEDLHSSESWTSQNSCFEDKDNASTASNSLDRLSYNVTSLDTDNPVLHDVSLSQSACLSQNTSLASRNFYTAEQNSTHITAGQGENDVDTTSCLSPTLTLSDVEYDQFCADEQVKEDIASAAFEQMNNASSVGDYFPEVDFNSTLNVFQHRTDSYASLSSVQSTQSSSGSSGCNDRGFENEGSVKMPVPEANIQHKEVYRGFGKLFPEVNEDFSRTDGSFQNERKPGQKFLCSTEKSMKVVHRRRGRRSKDEILVMKFNLPATAAAISEMSLSEMQRLSRSLSDEQRAVMKKIRRRGKNKVAARMCRQRKIMAPISVVSCERTMAS